MASRPIPTFGLGIDWETSGYSYPDYAKNHQGISFGAIIFDLRTFEPVEELYHEIQYNPRYQWDFGAEKVHGITRERLKSGVTQIQAATELGNLVVNRVGVAEIILLGHRVYFDRAFTDQLTDAAGFRFEWNATVIDTCSFGTALLEVSKSDDVFEIMGMPPRKEHNALEDIRYTLASMRKMKEYFLAGVAASME